MKIIILSAVSQSTEVSALTGYIPGAIIALLIPGYLVYTLIKPEKF